MNYNTSKNYRFSLFENNYPSITFIKLNPGNDFLKLVYTSKVGMILNDHCNGMIPP